MQLIAKITSEGKRKAFLAQQTGIQIKLSRIGLGNGAYTPSESQTRLRNEVVRLPIASSRIDTNSYTLYLHTILEGDTEFWVSEVGVYLDDGTLFAVWSDPSHKIAYKNRGTRLLIGFSLKLSEVPINTIQIIDQGQPLSLYYARELAEFGNAVVNLSNAVLENSFDILQERQNREESIKQVKEENKRQYEKIIARQEQALEAILSNTNTIITLSNAFINEKLKV